MANFTLNVPKNNTFRFTITVTGVTGLASYTGTLTVREKVTSTTNVIQVTHDSITSTTITFVVPYADNDITAKSYVYDVTITDGTNRYTIDLAGGSGTVPQTIGNYNIVPIIND